MKVECELIEKGIRFAGVYIIYNKISKRFYIGSTINSIERKYSHFYKLKNNKHENVHLQKAYNKYCKDSFIFGLITKYNYTKLQRDDVYNIIRKEEQFYIDSLNAVNDGYNIAPLVDVCSKSFNKIVQFSLDGEFIKIWDSVIEIEEELHISNIDGIRVCCNPNYLNRVTANGYIWVYHKDYIESDFDINTRLPSDIPINSTSVVQFDYFGNMIKIWNCMSDITREFGFNQHNISDCCSNHRRNANGFIWMYYLDYISKNFDEILKQKIVFNNTKYINKKKSVEQYDLNDNLIRTWESAKQADREGGFDYKNISACCTGKKKTHKDFKWKFVS